MESNPSLFKPADFNLLCTTETNPFSKSSSVGFALFFVLSTIYDNFVGIIFFFSALFFLSHFLILFRKDQNVTEPMLIYVVCQFLLIASLSDLFSASG